MRAPIPHDGYHRCSHGSHVRDAEPRRTEQAGPRHRRGLQATIYGIGLANLLALPMASRLKGLARQRSQMREILVEGLVSIAQGDNPRHIESKLQGFLS